MIHDIIVIGGGASGFTASLYSARAGMNTLLISKDFGGLASTAHKIMNWPGEYEIRGMDLMNKMFEQVKKNNVETKLSSVTEINKTDVGFKIKTHDGDFESKKIIYCLGTEHRKLNIEGEKEFYGKGVSYCATCDGPFFKNKTVAIIGGGNSALTAAILLSKHASKVYIIYRKENFFRAELEWIKEVTNDSKIEILYNEEITEISGEKFVKKISLKNSKRDLDVEGVFIEIGSDPVIDAIKNLVTIEEGYIKVDGKQETSLRGLFAAGDVTTGSNKFRQLTTACAEGAIAANYAHEEIIKDRN